MPNWYGYSIHGVNFLPELTAGSGPLLNLPGTDYVDVVGFPQGFGKTFRGRAQRTNWFHIALPCLDVVDHGTAKLGELQINFQTFDTAFVAAIHLHSAHSSPLPESRDGLYLYGDYRTRFEQNWFLFEPPVELSSGALCVSVLVAFGASDSNVQFTRAYARFVTE